MSAAIRFNKFEGIVTSGSPSGNPELLQRIPQPEPLAAEILVRCSSITQPSRI